MPRSTLLEPAAEVANAPATAPPDEAVPSPGPAAAVVLAAGLAAFTLGLLTVLTAVSGSVSSALTISERVGDLSGLTTLASAVFFAGWGLLALAWRHAAPPLGRVATVTAVLVALGLLGTFPPFVNAVAG